MQEDDHRGLLLGIVVVLRGIYPEVVAALDDPAMGRQEVVLCQRSDRHQRHQQ